MTKKPHEDTRLAKFVERRALELKPKKSQLQIASEAGFPNQNMVTMIKQGPANSPSIASRQWRVRWSATRPI